MEYDNSDSVECIDCGWSGLYAACRESDSLPEDMEPGCPVCGGCVVLDGGAVGAVDD